MAKLIALATLFLGAAAGIYPDDHWSYSTKLTVDNMETTVAEQVDAGKTMFAPAWNEVTQMFASNPDVAFGDVNLQSDAVRGNYNPGAGGWPTIRYFNKETGPDGAPYPKKTDKAMCDELGDMEYMQAYVEEMGQTSLCSTETGAGCSEKQKAFTEKMKAQGADKIAKQRARLEGMQGKKMKPELMQWLSQRLAILKQLDAKEEL